MPPSPPSATGASPWNQASPAPTAPAAPPAPTARGPPLRLPLRRRCRQQRRTHHRPGQPWLTPAASGSGPATGPPKAARSAGPGYHADPVLGRVGRVKAPTLAPATMATYERAYIARIAPHLGGSACRRSPGTGQGWLATMNGDPKRRSAEHAVETLGAILRTAMDWDRPVPRNAVGRWLRLATRTGEQATNRAARALTPTRW